MLGRMAHSVKEEWCGKSIKIERSVVSHGAAKARQSRGRQSENNVLFKIGQVL